MLHTFLRKRKKSRPKQFTYYPQVSSIVNILVIEQICEQHKSKLYNSESSVIFYSIIQQQQQTLKKKVNLFLVALSFLFVLIFSRVDMSAALGSGLLFLPSWTTLLLFVLSYETSVHVSCQTTWAPRLIATPFA